MDDIKDSGKLKELRAFTITLKSDDEELVFGFYKKCLDNILKKDIEHLLVFSNYFGIWIRKYNRKKYLDYLLNTLEQLSLIIVHDTTSHSERWSKIIWGFIGLFRQLLTSFNPHKLNECADRITILIESISTIYVNVPDSLDIKILICSYWGAFNIISKEWCESNIILMFSKQSCFESFLIGYNNDPLVFDLIVQRGMYNSLSTLTDGSLYSESISFLLGRYSAYLHYSSTRDCTDVISNALMYVKDGDYVSGIMDYLSFVLNSPHNYAMYKNILDIIANKVKILDDASWMQAVIGRYREVFNQYKDLTIKIIASISNKIVDLSYLFVNYLISLVEFNKQEMCNLAWSFANSENKLPSNFFIFIEKLYSHDESNREVLDKVGFILPASWTFNHNYKDNKKQ